jgi:hypothetical protein
MSELFVDTAGWGHLVDPSQAYHSLAAAIYRNGRQQGRKFITTNYVITELVALLILSQFNWCSTLLSFVTYVYLAIASFLPVSFFPFFIYFNARRSVFFFS